MANTQIAGECAQFNHKPTSIPEMVSRYAFLVDHINAMQVDLEDSPEDQALYEETQCIDARLASTPSLTLQDLRAKVKWLRMPSNFNRGDFDGPNETVLLSLFDDIERFAGV